ncbi:MAG: glutathione S-transferase family protein [Myxococcales bacterium]|nr:glutathione S-transferase family protein [Myxococcales bacterium]
MPTLLLCDFPAKTELPRWSSFSPFVLQIDRALALAKLPYEKHYVDMLKLKRLNPLGQLPVLVVDGENVADSTRILHRIEALAPGTMLRGLDARGQAEAWLWEEFADTALYPHVLTARWADDRGWPVPRGAFFGAVPAPLRSLVANAVRRGTIKKLVQRDFLRGGLEAAYERIDRVLDTLDARAPEQGFWVGEHPSVADLGLFAQLHSLRLPTVAHGAERIAARPRLERYLDRVDAATLPG